MLNGLWRGFAVILMLGLCGMAQALTPDEAAVLPDRVLGKPDAPVTIIEYASLTCGHCAQFHGDILPKIKEKYIETGKVKLIFRDFPLDGAALRAAAVARCMPESSFYAYIGLLFKNQDQWRMADDPVKPLAQFARLGGLGHDEAESCARSDKLMDALAEGRLKAGQYYQIQSTPSFVFNEGKDKITGAMPFEQFENRIEALLADHAKAVVKVAAPPQEKKDSVKDGPVTSEAAKKK